MCIRDRPTAARACWVRLSRQPKCNFTTRCTTSSCGICSRTTVSRKLPTGRPSFRPPFVLYSWNKSGVYVATITLKDFQEFARPRISDWLGSPAQFPQKLKEIFDFAVANEKFMDSEANAWFDNLLQVMANIFEEGLAKLPDSPEKRNNLRLVALTKNKHHRAAGFLRGLGSPLPRPFPVAEAAKPVFLASLQAVLDVLFDATRQTQNGVAQFACLSMLYWTIDELNVAFYLAERRYATQSYSHIRTVYDL